MARSLYGYMTDAVWVAAQPFVLWKRARGGREWAERLGALPEGRPGSVWIHAASVGEVGAASPLVDALSSRGVHVLFTALTPTGRALAERLSGAKVTVAFPPLDFTATVRQALARAAPRTLLLVETELWPNLIVEAASAGVTVGVVNGRLSDRSVTRYRLPGFPLSSVRESMAFVACRSRADLERYVTLGFPESRLCVCGDMKMDALGPPLSPSEREAIRSRLGATGAPVVVFGSVRPLEERAVVEAAVAAARSRSAHVVIAPRHLARVDHIMRRLSASGVPVGAWSGLSGDERPPALVLDTTGELARLYSVADVAFVGGSLAPYGGHNPLEPAAHGVPVVIGPYTESCEESARPLVSAGAAVVVERADRLSEAVLSILDDDRRKAAMGDAALATVRSLQGAVGRVVRLLESRGIAAEPPSEETQ